MSVQYSIVTRKNPNNRTAPAKYYPSAKVSGRSDLVRIASRISDMSCLSNGDTLAVLETLLHVIPLELADGRVVELGDFGSLRIILRTTGSVDSKDVNSTSILRARAHFRPGKRFRKMLDGLDFQKEVAPD
jgi:predicted histone-like DNA-binding protein